jgi:hypothetical protein
MFPEDRVLVAYVPDPQDFARLLDERWYRIPVKFAPKGLHAEYLAFYFGSNYGPQKWAIHYYARNLGHELTTRRALLPDQANHPHADELYYKVQLGEVQRLEQPIPSMRWRRVTFVHTTWDRFQEAAEINDLFLDGGPYVDRLYATLKDCGVQAERNYEVNEAAGSYISPLVIPCLKGMVYVTADELLEAQIAPETAASRLTAEAVARGGERKGPVAQGTFQSDSGRQSKI